MESMFYNCSSLENINLTNFSTKSVLRMDYMFFSCSKLKYLNLENFNTLKCISFNNIFGNCEGLELYLNPEITRNLLDNIPDNIIINNITSK